MVAAVKSTHITPPLALPFLGNSKFSCASPLVGPSELIPRSDSSYPPEIWFACVLLCWTQQGSGCLLKFPMGTTDCNPETSPTFKKAVCTSSSWGGVVCSRLIMVAHFYQPLLWSWSTDSHPKLSPCPTQVPHKIELLQEEGSASPCHPYLSFLRSLDLSLIPPPIHSTLTS